MKLSLAVLARAAGISRNGLLHRLRRGVPLYDALAPSRRPWLIGLDKGHSCGACGRRGHTQLTCRRAAA